MGEYKEWECVLHSVMVVGTGRFTLVLGKLRRFKKVDMPGLEKGGNAIYLRIKQRGWGTIHQPGTGWKGIIVGNLTSLGLRIRRSLCNRGRVAQKKRRATLISKRRDAKSSRGGHDKVCSRRGGRQFERRGNRKKRISFSIEERGSKGDTTRKNSSLLAANVNILEKLRGMKNSVKYFSKRRGEPGRK